MRSRAIASSLVLLLTVASARAQALTVLQGVDTAARRFTTEFRITGGPAGGVAFLILSPTLVAGVPTPFGMLGIDPFGLVRLTTVPLDAAGIGSATYDLPAATLAGVAFDAQALTVSTAGVGTLTNWVALGWYGNVPLTEIMAASYHPTTDRFEIRGKGPSGALMEVFRQNTPGTRDRVGGISVPFSNFSWSVTPVGLSPPGKIEVVTYGTIIILRLW